MDYTRFINELMDLSIIMYRINRSVNQSMDSPDWRCVSPIQIHTLIALRKKKTVNMTELADYLVMTRQQLTKLVDMLVEKDLVMRGTDPNNRRHVMIELTDNGNCLIEEMIAHQSGFMSRLHGRLCDGDAQKMLDALIVIKEILSKLQPAGEIVDNAKVG